MDDNHSKKILVVGATGFLGPVLVEELSLAGFQVVCAVRNLEKAARQLPFPGVAFCKVDMNCDLDSAVWLARLREHRIDIVVNNAGIANSFGDQSIENVNVQAPLALFKAMRRYQGERKEASMGVRVVQISTTGVDWPDCDDFPYPASKKRLENLLAGMEDLPHVIIRPNVIYEPERGHLLLEQIAKIPFIFYIGHEEIQPIHSRELAIGMVRLLLNKGEIQQTMLRASGPTPMTWRQVFAMASAALEKSQICYCSIPLRLAQWVTGLIQLLPDKLLYQLGILSKMDAETMVMMTRGSTASNKEWLLATGLEPIRLEDTYRAYRKGAESYTAFIQEIRKGSRS